MKMQQLLQSAILTAGQLENQLAALNLFVAGSPAEIQASLQELLESSNLGLLHRHNEFCPIPCPRVATHA